MSIDLRVYKQHRIAPIRFTRSTTAPPAGRYAPDPDDRGFTTYLGPVVGVCRNDSAQITVVRAMLDPAAPLWATSGDPSKLTIDPGSAKLADGEKVNVVFTAKALDGDAKLQIRAESEKGPIVGILTVHVSELIKVKCAVHRTAIYAPPFVRTAANTTTRSFADIDKLIAEVNRQWRPVGIEFTVDTRKDDTDLINQVSRGTPPIAPTAGTLLCPVYGSGEANENFTRLMATNKVANRLNLYFVHVIATASADGTPFYIGFGSAFYKGLVVSDTTTDLETQGHTLAHELGHILTLARTAHTNANDSHSDDDPQWSATVASRRHDLWSRRRLMYFMIGLQALERTGPGGRYPFDGMDTGYGFARAGHLITIKNLANDDTDNEYTDARNKAPSLFP